MANLQNQFIKFNSIIKIGFDESSSLREKRETILKDLQNGLKRLFLPNEAPRFSSFNQGSYAIGTGVKPLEGDDFDIDIGIVFKFSKNDYKPTEVKGWVFDALNTLNRTVEYKRPCVRVQYRRNYEKTFHVDLAIYSDPEYENFWERSHYIAKGYYDSRVEFKKWEAAEPFALVELLKKKFQIVSDRDQFRRVVRYLKRWKDYNFTSVGYAKPSGIALTALAYNSFRTATKNDWQTNKSCYDDLTAVNNLVSSIINQFSWSNRIDVTLPVKPFNNLLERLTDKQMLNFKNELGSLRNALTDAIGETDTVRACYSLQKVFGGEFPCF